MNAALHPVFQQALAPFMPPTLASTSDTNTTIRRWGRGNPSHNEVSSVFAVMAAAIRQNGALTDKCRLSLMDQLYEMGSEVDQDLCNQRAEIEALALLGVQS